MEKPAVIFSEAGFKMFLDFMKGVQETKAENNPVDALVREYFERTDRPDLSGKVEEAEAPNTEVKYDMDDVARVVYNRFKVTPGIDYNSHDICRLLVGHGFAYTPRSIAPVMRGVMNRYPEIVGLGGGNYMYDPEEGKGDNDEA